MDDIEEHHKWAVEWSERVQPASEARPVSLGHISERAAALPGGSPRAPERRIAGTTANHEVHRNAGVQHWRESRSALRELSTAQSSARKRQLGFDTASARPSASRTSSWITAIAAMVMVPTVVGFTMMDSPFSRFWNRQAGDNTFELASSSSMPTNSLVRQRNALSPRLVAHESRGISGEPVRLGLTLAGSAEGGVVLIAGLVPGMTLSSGRAAGADTWQLHVTDLADSWVGPPQHFIGEVRLTAELHLPDATVAHRQAINIEWIAAPAARPDQAPVAADSVRPEQVSDAATPRKIVPSSQLDPGEIGTAGATNEQDAAGEPGAGPRTEPRSRASGSRETAKAAMRRPGFDESAHALQQDRVRQPSRMPRADARAGSREFIDEHGTRHIILPRLRSEPIEDAPVLPYDLPPGRRR